MNRRGSSLDPSTTSRSTARSSTCFPSSSAEELDSYLGVCNALELGSSAASLPPRTPPIHNLKFSPSVSSASLRASPPPRTPRDQSQGQSPKTGHLSLRPFSESAALSSSLQVLCIQERSPHRCHHSAPPSPPPLTLGRRRWRPPAPLPAGSSPPTGSRTARRARQGSHLSRSPSLWGRRD